MNVLIITQDAPIYLPWFLDRFVAGARAGGHRIFLTRLSGLHKDGVLAETARRFFYYGPADFCRMLFAIAAEKLKSRLRFHGDAGCHSVSDVVRRHGLVEIETASVNDTEFVGRVKSAKIDLAISIAAPEIFRSGILTAPRYGCINYHTALLPKNRGRQPLFFALLDGATETGVTVHEMNRRLDDGPILAQAEFRIAPGDSLHRLYVKSMRVGVGVLLRAVEMKATGDPRRLPNPRTRATYHGFPSRREVRRFRKSGKTFF